MIVYKRLLKVEDIKNLDENEELIYYQDDNIAYVINTTSDSYVVRRKKIFNNQLTDERFVKTPHQIIKMVE